MATQIKRSDKKSSSHAHRVSQLFIHTPYCIHDPLSSLGITNNKIQKKFKKCHQTHPATQYRRIQWVPCKKKIKTNKKPPNSQWFQISKFSEGNKGPGFDHSLKAAGWKLFGCVQMWAIGGDDEIYASWKEITVLAEWLILEFRC